MDERWRSPREQPRAASPPRPDRLPAVLLVVATAWSALLVVAGTIALVGENGLGVIVTLSVPFALVCALGAVLGARRRRGRRGPGWAGWTITALTGLFALLGMLTVGVFVLPVFFCLLVTCARLQGASPVLVPAEPPPSG